MQAAVSRSRITMVLVGVFALMALAKIKPPNEWAQTHFLFSYDLGVTRRALLGEALQLFGFDGLTNAQAHLVAIFVTLAGGLALTLWIARHIPQTQLGLTLGLVCVTSVAMAVFLGNTGYLDGILLCLGVIALSIPGQSISAVVAKAALCCIGVLVHEAMAGTVAVIVAAQLWFNGARLLAPLPVLASGLLGVLLLSASPYADTALTGLSDAVSTRAIDFNARSIAIEAVLRFRDGMVPSFVSFWEGPNYLFERTFVLPIGVGYVLVWMLLSLRVIPHRDALDRLALAAVMLGPLALLFVAYDLPRFLGLTILQGFVVLLLLINRDAAAAARLPQVFTPLVLVGFLVANALIAFPPLNPVPSHYDQLPGALLDLEEWAD